MKAQTLSNALLLVALCCFWSTKAAAIPSGLQKRDIPRALYLSCHGGQLTKLCARTLDEAWSNGKLKTVGTERQTFTGSHQRCKLDFWGEENVAVTMHTVDQYKAALQQIDDYCHKIGFTGTDPLYDTAGYSGTFVGRLSGQFVAIVYKTT